MTVRWSAAVDDAAAMDRLGQALGRAAPAGAVVLLEGPLGAGKTTLAQGVARGCGVEEPVASPTYNLVLHYRGRRPFTHVDLYRLTDAGDLATLDVDEILSGEGVTCVEWPDLLRERAAPPCAAIVIEPSPRPDARDARRVKATCRGDEWREASEALAGAGAAIEA